LHLINLYASLSNQIQYNYKISICTKLVTRGNLPYVRRITSNIRRVGNNFCHTRAERLIWHTHVHKPKRPIIWTSVIHVHNDSDSDWTSVIHVQSNSSDIHMRIMAPKANNNNNWGRVLTWCFYKLNHNLFSTYDNIICLNISNLIITSS